MYHYNPNIFYTILKIMYNFKWFHSYFLLIIMTQKKTETKRDRFVRLAEKRTNEVLDRLRILGGCANKRMYEYSKTDVDKIFRAIDNEMKRVKGMFMDEKRSKFSL